mgnify:CR=1 FL=1
MKYPYVFVFALLISVSLYSQNKFKKATFKNGNPNVVLADFFTQLTGVQHKGSGTIIVSFTLTESGEITKIHPLQFDTQKNAINAILAIQKTSKHWSSTFINGLATSHKYKIAYNFISANSSYEMDVRMAAKFSEKKMFKKALKYYNRAVDVNKNEASLYLSRAEVKLALNDMDGLKSDLTMCKKLQNEYLANVLLTGFQSNKNKKLTYINKEKK